MVNFVNENGGWAVISWYRRGESDDVNRVENGEELLVNTEEFQHHVVHILLTNRGVTNDYNYKR